MRLGLRLVNAPWEDPALYVDVEGQAQAWLVDCGSLAGLRPRDLLRVERVFVSHAHIDHLIGFDHLLRMHLGGAATVTVYGPPGITAHVQGKLAGYVWNLVQGSKLAVQVCEVWPEEVRLTSFPCCQRFAPEPSEVRPHQGSLELPGGARLRFAEVEHGVECLAWVLEEPEVLSVDPQALRAEGVPPGPWLSRLKEKVAAGDRSGELEVAGRRVPVADLAGRLVRSRPGRRHAYVTDTAFNKKSVAALRPVARGVDELWCEAAYLHAQREKARDNMHMTARQAGRLAAELDAGALYLFHYSRRYQGAEGPHLQEAREVFPRTLEAPRYVPSGAPGSSGVPWQAPGVPSEP